MLISLKHVLLTNDSFYNYRLQMTILQLQITKSFLNLLDGNYMCLEFKRI